MREHKIETNGTVLHVTDHSQGGEPVLFLHPSGFFNSFIWNPVLPYFKEDYRVITADLRGHGRSDMPADGYGMDNQARDIVGVLDALGLDSVHVAGNSLGGKVGVYLAAQFPERVRSLVLVDDGVMDFIGPEGEREGTKEEVVTTRLQRPVPTYASREEFERYAVEMWSHWGDDFVRATLAHAELQDHGDGTYRYEMPGEILGDLMNAICDIRFEEIYPQVKCPVLYFPAEAEPQLETKLRHIAEWTARLPYVKTIVIPGSEHIMMPFHHAEVSAGMRDFYQHLRISGLVRA
jgi:pimeloyl-ACP methyl ester carboxylesterase